MENRVAVISIIVEDYSVTQEINQLLHGYHQYIIGRMGLPYEKRKIAMISIAIDAPQDSINELSGKLGQLPYVSTKILYSKYKNTL